MVGSQSPLNCIGGPNVWVLWLAKGPQPIGLKSMGDVSQSGPSVYTGNISCVRS
uniref:Uncharacterized protein n=1 Tax=Anguilla anguilla TaxID=7936 RepID=A0A0E9VY33_ANGAN